MFATGGPRCPVGIMEAMIVKRPDELTENAGPLYLRPLPQPKGAVWFSKQPVGVNTINQYIKNITNHSTRKTLVKKLKKAGVDGRNVTAITGHETEESLRDYDENDLKTIVDLAPSLAVMVTAHQNRMLSLPPQMCFYHLCVLHQQVLLHITTLLYIILL